LISITVIAVIFLVRGSGVGLSCTTRIEIKPARAGHGAAEDRWLHEGDLPREFEDKLSECLWWVLVLADHLGVDITKAFTTRMNDLDVQLTKSVARSNKTA